jgi:hypothetical protein
MALHLRKRRTEPLPDEHLTYFTEVEAAEFRRLVAQSFARAGRDVDVFGDHLEDPGGTTIGLWNIGTLCVGADVSDWPAVIDEHVKLVTVPARAVADLTEEQFEQGLHLRLVETGSVPDPETLAYARVVAPGLLEVLSVDVGEAVANPSREEMGGLGAIGWLVARGRANLRAVLEDDELRAETVGERGAGGYTAVGGPSRFTASLALLLAETVERFTGEDDWGRGVLVAVPFRHQLLYRPLDAPDAEVALEHMLEAAQRAYHGEAGAVSPEVFWVRRQGWVQVTSTEGGEPHVLRDTGLREALEGL